MVEGGQSISKALNRARRGGDVTNYVEGSLKRLRASQPFNRIATSAVRHLLAAVGLQSEFVIKHLHRVGLVQRDLPNGRRLCLWSRADDWVSNQVYWRGWGGYEPESAPLFFRLASRAQVTIDVGAYVGFYTLLAAHANPAGRVYAFEPLPEVYERLQSNLTLNGVQNVRCVASAVGDHDGAAEFFSTKTRMQCSSSLSYEFMHSAEELYSFQVPVLTLDRFIRENGVGKVGLVKIDTESTEPQVLLGMSEALSRDRPTILCEVLRGSGSAAQLEDILYPLGYRYYLLTPDGPVRRDRIEGHPVHLNYLFTTLDADDVARLWQAL